MSAWQVAHQLPHEVWPAALALPYATRVWVDVFASGCRCSEPSRRARRGSDALWRSRRPRGGDRRRRRGPFGVGLVRRDAVRRVVVRARRLDWSAGLADGAVREAPILPVRVVAAVAAELRRRASCRPARSRSSGRPRSRSRPRRCCGRGWRPPRSCRCRARLKRVGLLQPAEVAARRSRCSGALPRRGMSAAAVETWYASGRCRRRSRGR